MILSLSTRWNASRHRSGEAMIEEILAAGFDSVELGYDLRLDLVAGVRAMVARKAVTVGSVHNFCPLPVGAPVAHPELFELASLDRRMRESAVRHTLRTVEFAAEVGARAVVLHAGNVRMWRLTGKLVRLCEKGRRDEPRYERIKLRLLARRARKAPPYLAALCQSVEELLPSAQAAGVCLAFENLPSWEAVPTEVEMESLARRFASPHVGYWHDFGHAQVRENLRLVNHHHWLERLRPWLAGAHVHDVAPPACDHLLPPDGQIDFAAFQPCLKPGMPLVLEPAPGLGVERIVAAARFLCGVWAGGGPPPAAATP
jgi:sugar phosphate isomerase/epimerase